MCALLKTESADRYKKEIKIVFMTISFVKEYWSLFLP
uniref:Uncharacterized protein n=1 Tax=Anguilla anguilla TaxID=7936 RepID=A0A0E9UF35_ANGAN